MITASKVTPVSLFIDSDVLQLDDTGVDLSVVQLWIRNCFSSHDHCNQYRIGLTHKPVAQHTVTRLPTRVIQIQLDNTGSLEAFVKMSTKNESGDYLALSYRWGGPQHIVLTSSTFATFSTKGGLSFASLPQGLQHALKFTHKLGYKYLWVDALCILQDSAQDKYHEISNMQNYYSNAALTIQPSGMNSVADGFLGEARIIREKTEHFLENIKLRCPNSFELPILGKSKESLVLTLEPKWYDPPSESVNTRAWVLQERLLCPRVLIFPSIGGVIFQCETTETFRGKIHYQDDQIFGKFGRARLELASHNSTHKLPELFKSWTNIVNDYAARDLSEPQDKLLAIAGLAGIYSTRFATRLGHYFFGHWENLFTDGLLWSVANHKMQPRPKIARAPSWSWASVDRSRYTDTSGSYEKHEVQILDLHMFKNAPVQQAGSLPITMLARLRPLFWSPRNHNDRTIALYTAPSHDTELSYQAAPDCIEEQPVAFEEVSCMSVISDDPYTQGLVLKKYGTDSYRRVGYFSVYREKTPSVFEGIEKQVVTIV
jgi:Heterokaryon incompatibility protein (HET)